MPGKRFKTRQAFDPRYVRNEQRRSYRMAMILFWSLLLYFFFQNYVISLGILQEHSMLPAMSEGETFLVNKYLYTFRKPRRGEVIVMRTFPAAPEQYVKRVIAVPGDTLTIQRGLVLLNGRPLPEPYASGPTYPDLGPVLLKKGEYFVMGDNRRRSEDSRKFGPVNEKDIRGKIAPGKLFAFN